MGFMIAVTTFLTPTQLGRGMTVFVVVVVLAAFIVSGVAIADWLRPEKEQESW